MCRISFNELTFQEYSGGKIPEYFRYDSEDDCLVEFYNEDAESLHNQSITKIVNVLYNGRMVGYCAFATSEIKYLHLEKDDKYSTLPHPSLKLGRLLVCKKMKKKGIGFHIITYFVEKALALNKEIPIRFLLVDALPNAVSFYVEKCGFVNTRILKGKDRDLALLYIDINKFMRKYDNS